MSKMGAHVAIDGAKENVVMHLSQDGAMLGHIIFDPATAESFARQVALSRSRLTDQVPMALDPGARLEAVPVSSWWVPESHTGGPGKLIVLRHPGYGWLTFHFPPEEAQRLGNALLERPPEPQSSTS